MGKLDFKARTLGDEVVKDGLCAVSALDNYPRSMGLCFVVGGIATQSYLPQIFWRLTSDIDLAALQPLSSHTDIEEFAIGAVEYLRDNGYTTELKKGHVIFPLIYYKADGTNVGVIEFPRRNPHNYWEKKAENLERELIHSRKKIVSGRDATYRVASPEDIVVPKIVRGIGTLKRDDGFCHYILSNKLLPLTEELISDGKREIESLRDEAILHAGDTRYAEHLRFVSDIFDIRALSEVTGFDERYLFEVMSNWESTKENTETKKLLVNYLFPKLEKHD